MNLAVVEKIVNAVLYEGFILYPYRSSTLKNRQRRTFGGLFPEDYHTAKSRGDASRMQTQCLVRGNHQTQIEVRIRFLHIIDRQVGELPEALAELPKDFTYRPVARTEISGQQYLSWQEAREREVAIPLMNLRELQQQSRYTLFSFTAGRNIEILRRPDDLIAGLVERKQLPVCGEITVSAQHVVSDVFILEVAIENHSSVLDANISREQAQLQAMACTHMVLGCENGEFISLLDPPQELKHAAASCNNQGCWPVLVGKKEKRDTLLSSPIILYDYPRIAPESPDDLFDDTEIDETLTLRILTMADEEKQEMTAVDRRVRARRSVYSNRHHKPELASLRYGDTRIKIGDHVRLHPRGRADILDVVLTGKTAVIEAIERDFEDQVHVAVTIDDDQGCDMELELLPGHRFFFSLEEIELLRKETLH